MSAFEEIGSGVAIGTKASDVALDLLTCPADATLFSLEHVESVFQLSTLLVSDSADECSGVVAVVEPVLLLPASEASARLEPTGSVFPVEATVD